MKKERIVVIDCIESAKDFIFSVTDNELKKKEEYSIRFNH
jgi:hypothetical protein